MIQDELVGNSVDVRLRYIATNGWKIQAEKGTSTLPEPFVADDTILNMTSVGGFILGVSEHGHRMFRDLSEEGAGVEIRTLQATTTDLSLRNQRRSTNTAVAGTSAVVDTFAQESLISVPGNHAGAEGFQSDEVAVILGIKAV